MDARRHRLIQRRGWDRAAIWYEPFWQRQLQPVRKLLLSKAALGAGERVIDVACGSGGMTMAVAAAVSPGGHVVATDLSPQMTAATEALAVTTGTSNVETACCSSHRTGRRACPACATEATSPTAT